VAACWADASQAFKALGWQAGRGLVQMCDDSWKWQVKGSADRFWDRERGAKCPQRDPQHALKVTALG